VLLHQPLPPLTACFACRPPVSCLPAVPTSVLFLGRPGVGKTTVIREMARVLSGAQQRASLLLLC